MRNGTEVDTSATRTCHVCYKPGCIHGTEIRNDEKTDRSFCFEHAPAEMRDKMPFGPHCTPAEEVAFRLEQLDAIHRQVTDPAPAAKFKAELEKLIADIEAGRRRIGDAD